MKFKYLRQICKQQQYWKQYKHSLSMKAHHEAISKIKERRESQVRKLYKQKKKYHMLLIRQADQIVIKQILEDCKDELTWDQRDLLQQMVQQTKKESRLYQSESLTQSQKGQDCDLYYKQVTSLSIKQRKEFESKISVKTFHEQVQKICKNFNDLSWPINKLMEKTIDYVQKSNQLEDPEQQFLSFNKYQFDFINSMLKSVKNSIQNGQEALRLDVQKKKRASQIKRISSKISNQSNQSEIKSFQGSAPTMNGSGISGTSGIQEHINQNDPRSAQVQVVEREDRSTDQFKPSFDQ